MGYKILPEDGDELVCYSGVCTKSVGYGDNVYVHIIWCNYNLS